MFDNVGHPQLNSMVSHSGFIYPDTGVDYRENHH
jgi:hypothetical protein